MIISQNVISETPVSLIRNWQKLLALLFLLLVLGLQWLLWEWIQAFVWFLLFPTIFQNSRLRCFHIGLLSTLISTAFVWYMFIPPQQAGQSQPHNAVAGGDSDLIR